MSAAINQLHLEQPPATIERLDGRYWRIVCDCGTPTTPADRISDATQVWTRHCATVHPGWTSSDIQTARYRTSLQRLVDEITPPKRRVA